MVKYYHAKGIKKSRDIALYMRTKGMLVGRTWVQDRLRKYREDGDPNSRDARSDSRRATTAERRWLKQTLAGPAASGMSASRLLDMPFSRGSFY